MKLLITTIFSVFILSEITAQTADLNSILPECIGQPVCSHTLFSDSLSSSFLIWLETEVPAHYHAQHTEQLYVLEGMAEMTIEKDTFLIKAGDYIAIPKGLVHSARKIGDKTLKVLSVQAPEFLGKDRVFVGKE